MTPRNLMGTGAVGAIVATICCATPLLAAALGVLGLSGWLAGADYVVFGVMLAGMALLGLGLYRHHLEAAGVHASDKEAGSRR